MKTRERLFIAAAVLTFSTARVEALTLKLAWDPVVDPSVAGYELAYGTAHNGPYPNRLDVGNASQVIVAGLDDHTTYYFVVRTYDLNKAHFSADSSELSYSPLSVTCAANVSAQSPDGNPVVVNFNSPSVAGAVPPVTASCTPASGTAFAVGSRAVTCTILDIVTSASCQLTVSVADASGGGGGTGGGTGGSGGGGGTGGGTSGGGTSGDGGGSGTSSDPTGGTSTTSSGPTSTQPATGPAYEIPPPPGSSGFTDHGYYRPDGGWQETRLITSGSYGGATSRVIVSGGCTASAGVPVFEIPAPPGASGFSDHGYYRPDGGWTETRQLAAAGGSSCVTVLAGSSGPSSNGTNAPAGSYGFSDHGYFRPDGGWQETARVGGAGDAAAIFSAAAPVAAAAPAATLSTPVMAATQAGAASATTASTVTVASSTAVRPISTVKERTPVAAVDPVPINAMTSIAMEFDLVWRDDGTAVSYDVYLGTTLDPPLALQGLRTTTAHVSGLTPATTYYWRVVAHNAAGEATSSTWRFTTARQ